MTVKLTKYLTYELMCESHLRAFRWREELETMPFLEALTYWGWGYEFQNKTMYYCPICLKELGLPAGQIDIRSTIK